MGNPGCGKTYFCHALLNYDIKMKCFNNRRYWTERELLGRLRKDMEFGSYQEFLKYLIDDELLIVDDLGSVDYGDWGRKIVFEVIDERYESRLPTIFSTNLNEESLKKEFGDRAHSRLFSKENTIIDVRGRDLRQEICL